MCGIYGTTIKYNETQVKEKLQRTAFRGPDKMGWNFYNSNHSVIFGHNRLSIVDLDPRSDQPFTYQNHIHVAFNGEIYNFKSIKDILIKKGYQFRTTSDTEVLCAAYLEYGENCVHHFSGMFAFVIYDEQKQQFFGARDRLGKKPFYYYHNGKDFEFSSQISSIQLHHQQLSISEKAIAFYLAWGSIPEPQSIFNEIKKLLPGHSFTFDLNTGSFNSKQYWDIDYKTAPNYQGSYEDAKKDLSSILSDAVSSRLFADVPVGVFLSGGVDSSVVSAFATKTSSTKIKTFSVKFNEKGFDESMYAQQVANHLQTDHHVIECNYNEGIDLIENFSTFYDEPFADSSAIPSMLLAKYTKKQVTVALSGDGGDESFIGYHRYNWIKKGNRIYWMPYAFRKFGASILALAPNYRLKLIAEAVTYKDVNETYLAGMTGVDLSYIKTNIDYMNFDERKYLEHTNKNLYERISDYDIKTYLNWDINTKVDRATMAFSLEARAPLMDHRIVEFARSLPTEFKFQGNNQKRILKDVLYDHVPKAIFDRPKAGFTMPFSDWFKKDLKDFVLSELNDDGLKSIPCIDVEKVSFMIQQHMNGTWNRYPLIWKLLVLKQWLDKNKLGLTIK
uniref:asparagine synthase (glutamine-hydrolyzing) n=1 Tax=Gelidibacter sp. TaxID=2018083 RepID=UPI004049A099